MFKILPSTALNIHPAYTGWLKSNDPFQGFTKNLYGLAHALAKKFGSAKPLNLIEGEGKAFYRPIGDMPANDEDRKTELAQIALCSYLCSLHTPNGFTINNSKDLLSSLQNTNSCNLLNICTACIKIIS